LLFISFVNYNLLIIHKRDSRQIDGHCRREKAELNSARSGGRRGLFEAHLEEAPSPSWEAAIAPHPALNEAA